MLGSIRAVTHAVALAAGRARCRSTRTRTDAGEAVQVAAGDRQARRFAQLAPAMHRLGMVLATQLALRADVEMAGAPLAAALQVRPHPPKLGVNGALRARSRRSDFR